MAVDQQFAQTLTDEQLEQIASGQAGFEDFKPKTNPVREKLDQLTTGELEQIAAGRATFQDFAPAPGIGEQVLQGVQEAGEFVDKFTGAPTRAAIGAAQQGKSPFSAFGRQFGEDPKLAPTGQQIAERAGISGERTDIPLTREGLPVQPSGSGRMADFRGGPFLVDQPRLKGFGTIKSPSSPAAGAGLAIDIAADPLNIVPGVAGAKFTQKAAKGGVKLAGQAARATGRGAFKGADLLSGGRLKTATDVAKKAGAAAGEVFNKTFNPRRADDFQELFDIAERHYIDPKTLPEAIEFGTDSTITRTGRKLAESGNEKRLRDFHASLREVQNATEDYIAKITDPSAFAGGTPLSQVDAGNLIRSSYDKAIDNFFKRIDITHNEIMNQVPGMRVSPKRIEALESKLVGVERFAKGRVLRGVNQTQKTQGQQLLNAIAAIRAGNGSYKQTLEALRDIGEVAFKTTKETADITPDIKRLREIYFKLDDALVGTVDDLLGGDLAKRLRTNNAAINKFLTDKRGIAKIVTDSKRSPESVFNALILSGDSQKINTLKKILPPETIQQLKGSFATALIKKNPDGGFAFKTLFNSMRNKKNQMVHLFSPEEIKELGDLVRLGDRFGNPVLSTSGTGASNAFTDIGSALQAGFRNEAFQESLKVRARAPQPTAIERAIDIAPPARISLQRGPGEQAAKGLQVLSTQQNALGRAAEERQEPDSAEAIQRKLPDQGSSFFNFDSKGPDIPTSMSDVRAAALASNKAGSAEASRLAQEGFIPTRGGGKTNVLGALDSVTAAPLRRAIQKLQRAESPLLATLDQFGRDPKTAPTGEEISAATGAEGDLGKAYGLLLEAGIDPSIIATGPFKAGALALGALGGIKKVGKAADVAQSVGSLTKKASALSKEVSAAGGVERTQKLKELNKVRKELFDKGVKGKQAAVKVPEPPTLKPSAVDDASAELHTELAEFNSSKLSNGTTNLRYYSKEGPGSANIFYDDAGEANIRNVNRMGQNDVKHLLETLEKNGVKLNDAQIDRIQGSTGELVDMFSAKNLKKREKLDFERAHEEKLAKLQGREIKKGQVIGDRDLGSDRELLKKQRDARELERKAERKAEGRADDKARGKFNAKEIAEKPLEVFARFRRQLKSRWHRGDPAFSRTQSFKALDNGVKKEIEAAFGVKPSKVSMKDNNLIIHVDDLDKISGEFGLVDSEFLHMKDSEHIPFDNYVFTDGKKTFKASVKKQTPAANKVTVGGKKIYQRLLDRTEGEGFAQSNRSRVLMRVGGKQVPKNVEDITPLLAKKKAAQGKVKPGKKGELIKFEDLSLSRDVRRDIDKLKELGMPEQTALKRIKKEMEKPGLATYQRSSYSAANRVIARAEAAAKAKEIPNIPKEMSQETLNIVATYMKPKRRASLVSAVKKIGRKEKLTKAERDAFDDAAAAIENPSDNGYLVSGFDFEEDFAKTIETAKRGGKKPRNVVDASKRFKARGKKKTKQKGEADVIDFESAVERRLNKNKKPPRGNGPGNDAG